MTHVLGMLDDSGTFHELIPVPSTIGRDHRAHADASKSKTQNPSEKGQSL